MCLQAQQPFVLLQTYEANAGGVVGALAAQVCACYTVITYSHHASVPNPVRVGRDPGANPGCTRASVAIGFGSPAGDTGVTRLDLNDILVRHPQATFLMRISGEAMREVGIDSGDLVLID